MQVLQRLQSAWICLEKILLVVRATTAWRTSSSERNFFPPIASLSGPNIWKSLGTRSGEYGGWGRHSKCRSLIVATVVQAVWGVALSCCKRTPDDGNPRCFDLIAGRRWIFLEIWVWCTGDSGPSRRVMLQNNAFFVPKESQHNLPCWWFCSKLLWFWWWGMVPFLARSLRFRLVEVNPGFVPSNDSCKEAITFSFKAPKKFFTNINTSLSQFRSHLPWHPSCRHFVKLEHIMYNVVCWTMTNL